MGLTLLHWNVRLMGGRTGCEAASVLFYLLFWSDKGRTKECDLASGCDCGEENGHPLLPAFSRVLGFLPLPHLTPLNPTGLFLPLPHLSALPSSWDVASGPYPPHVSLLSPLSRPPWLDLWAFTLLPMKKGETRGPSFSAWPLCADEHGYSDRGPASGFALNPDRRTHRDLFILSKHSPGRVRPCTSPGRGVAFLPSCRVALTSQQNPAQSTAQLSGLSPQSTHPRHVAAFLPQHPVHGVWRCLDQ